MSINKIKRKRMNKLAVWRLVYIATSGAIICGMMFFVYFIYQNIYATLSNTLAISVINVGTDVDIVDEKAYDKARELIKNKMVKIAVPAKIRNIFSNYVNNATSTPNKQPSR